MIQASHTKSASPLTLRLLPAVGLVDLADAGLPERLAGTVSDQLEAFASKMREGLLAASVAIGLDVMGELIEAEVTDVAGPKGRHDKGRRASRYASTVRRRNQSNLSPFVRYGEGARSSRSASVYATPVA